MTLLFPDADDIADRADQARQADLDATCQHGYRLVDEDCYVCDRDRGEQLFCVCTHHEGEHFDGEGCYVRGCPCWWWPR